ncbi:MAG: D-alanyl-D-alanine endopeptidase [Cytophagales bacterium]|nr:D-alanyl-D-alanine endopeptidase [Cytophagales bacterium]
MRLIHIFLATLIFSFAWQAQAQAQPKKKAATAKHAQKSSQAKKPVLASKAAKRGKKVARVTYEAPSMGRMTGLHSAPDALDLKSSVALVVDQDTNEVLFSKNESAILPIASITKLMTGIVVSEANLPMDEMLTITQEDVQNASFSRLKAGTSMTRRDMLHVALMSSENRAAYALGRTYPDGLDAFVRLMNAKAQSLGMTNTHYVEPTGLSSDNRSTAQDLAKLVAFASKNPTVSELSTSHGFQLAMGKRTMSYVNTNRLTSNPNWDIEVQKTGYITAAGRCLVMQTKVAGRKLVMVFLDSMGKSSRLGDAERVRAWVESRPANAPHA